MELALDFEAHAGQPLPPALQAKFTREMSLQEKGCTLRQVVTLLGKAPEHESIILAKMMHHCRLLTSMGAGRVMGMEGCPLLMRPWALWGHLMRLRAYREVRCA